MSLKLIKEEILKEFEDYSPPNWMVETIQRISKKYGEKIIDKCAKEANIEIIDWDENECEYCKDRIPQFPVYSVDWDSILKLKEKL